MMDCCKFLLQSYNSHVSLMRMYVLPWVLCALVLKPLEAGISKFLNIYIQKNATLILKITDKERLYFWVFFFSLLTLFSLTVRLFVSNCIAHLAKQQQKFHPAKQQSEEVIA